MKRAASIAMGLGVSLALATSSVGVSAAPTPKTVIDDPIGDSNFINDQGTGDGSFGDQTAADAGTVSDLDEIRMSNDAKNLYVTIMTEAAPPALTGIGYRVRVNPDGAGGTYCVHLWALFGGANNVLTQGEAWLEDVCGGSEPLSLELLGTTLTVPRDALDAFGKGATLTAPQAQAFLWNGSSYPLGFAGPYADTTLVGEDYKFVDKKKKK